MQHFLEYRTAINETMERLPWSEIQRVVEILHQAWLEGKQIYIMGNGGSATTASHFACDLGKNTAVAGLRRLRVMSLNDNMALFSAHANDNGYASVFAEQLINFVREGDIVLAISASGNSPNVLKAVDYANSVGAFTIGWSGYEGGKLSQSVDLPIVVSNDCIEQIEDIHLMLGHIVTVSLRQSMQEHVSLETATFSNAEAEKLWQP